MQLKKITEGFVVQTFDTDKKEFTEQSFTTGDQCTYEDTDGNIVEPDEFNDENGNEAYLPYHMLQPNQQKAVYDLLEYGQCQIPNSIWENLKNNFPI